MGGRKMKNPPTDSPVIDPEDGMVSAIWAMWFSSLWNIGSSVDGSGVTADRPIKNLFVGRPFFDTTLGKPIWLKSVRPTVWVLADGTAA